MIPEGIPKPIYPGLMLSKLHNPSGVGGLPFPPPEKGAQAKSPKGKLLPMKFINPFSIPSAFPEIDLHSLSQHENAASFW